MAVDGKVSLNKGLCSPGGYDDISLEGPQTDIMSSRTGVVHPKITQELWRQRAGFTPCRVVAAAILRTFPYL
jgi:hypothetical protein